MMLKLPDFSGS